MSSPVGPHASANGGKRGHHDTRYSTGQGCFGRVRFNGHRNVENPEPSRQGRSTKYVRVAIVVHISEALRGIFLSAVVEPSTAGTVCVRRMVPPLYSSPSSKSKQHKEEVIVAIWETTMIQ